MSETEYLGLASPAGASYEINEGLVNRRSPGWKITKPKNVKLGWKTIKLSGAAVALYENSSKYNSTIKIINFSLFTFYLISTIQRQKILFR